MSGLSGSQAAATLATTLVGAKLGLFDKQTINAVLVVILASLVVTPALVSLFGKRVTAATEDEATLGKTVLVPVWGESTPTGAGAWRDAGDQRRRHRPGGQLRDDGGVPGRAQAAQRGLTTRRRGGWPRKGSSRGRCFASPRRSPRGCWRRSWAKRRRCSSTSGGRARSDRARQRAVRGAGALAGADPHRPRRRRPLRTGPHRHPPRQPGASRAPEPGAGGGAGAPVRPRPSASGRSAPPPIRCGRSSPTRRKWIGSRRAIPSIGSSATCRRPICRSSRGSTSLGEALSVSRRSIDGRFLVAHGRARGDDLPQARGAGGRPGRRRAKSQASPSLTSSTPTPKFVATFATRSTDARNCHVPQGEEDSARRSSVPPARGGPAGTGPHAGGRRVRDRSRDRAFRVRRPAHRRALPGDGPRVARRGGRGRQRGQEPQARRPGGHDGAPSLRQPRLSPLSPQPSGLLRHRRLHRARHHAPARLHDRRGGRSADNMHVVPREIADIAVLTEPLTIAEKALIELDSVAGPHALGQPGQGGEAGDERGGARRGAGRPPRRAGAAGAGLRHLDLLPRERQQPARRLGREDGRPATSSPGKLPSATSASSRERRSHLRGDRLGGPGLRRPPRSGRTASSSSPAFPATRRRSASTPS